VKLTKNFIIIFSLLFLTVPDQLFAQGGNIQLGNLKIIPSISGQAMYDTNIYLKNGSDDAANKKENDWIYHVMPGIMLNYTIPERGQINLGYQGDWAFYNKNTDNNWKSQKVMFGVDYKAPRGLILGIDNIWNTTEDPYGSADQYAQGRVTKRWTDDLKGKVGYNFANVFKALLYYNFSKQEYKDILDFGQNYDSHEYGLGLETRIMTRTWGFVRYHYGQKTYNTFYDGLTSDFNSDFTYHRASAGLTWDPTAKINGELNVGYMWKTYKNEFTDATQSSRRNNTNTWVAATALTYKPLTKTVITFTFDRALRDSDARTNEYFEDTGFGISLKQTILTKLELNVGGGYSQNKYNGPVGNDRKDDNYSANAGLDYNIQKWLTVGVAYKYIRKNSNITVNEYIDEQGIATLKITY
jgi:hypothetical protein